MKTRISRTRSAAATPSLSGMSDTTWLLMARYRGMPLIPIETVCADYFRHLTPEALIRKVSAGEIALPLVRIEASAKCAKGVGLIDLAVYLNQRMEAARKECRQLSGS
ncbi:pyocin activator PrtN family protein [Methylobacterium guangdongense]|uniref:pyocin activator PrtN family protein n=1 Tax=Methylobacterium guangdongense TaxID=3138811 RepID=UPI00399C7B82